MRKIDTLALALTILVLCGCGNWLSVQPQGEVIPKTDEEFAAIIHNRLRDIEGGEDEFVIGNMDVIARTEGYADNLDANIKAGTLILYSGEDINTMQSKYEDAWKIVRDCNIVIENLNGRDTDIARGCVSAAYAMKGIVYYNLIRNYCQPWDEAEDLPGIPEVDNFDINAKPSRGTLKETYSYTMGLLDKALSYNPEDKTYIFTTYIIKAYEMKLAFWFEDWDKVISLGTDIMKNSGYELTTTADYADMINSKYEAKGEVLVRSHINNSSELDWYFSYTKGFLASRPVCSSLVKLFGPEPEKDVRFAASFNSKRLNVKVPECRVRLSEVVLMLAEANYHKGNNDSALGYVNDLRRQRITGVEDLTLATLEPVREGDRIIVDCRGKAVTPLLQAIFDERRKELYMEGDRWFELKRNGCPEWWIISNGLKYTTKKYLYTSPISKGDVDFNPDIVQNPGYIF